MSEGTEKKQILIVEDDESVACALRRLLCAGGYAVSTAASCASALEAVREKAFDLYLIDMRLPDGHGCALVAEMQSVRPAPAIAISSDADPHHFARGVAAGFDDYLPKPVPPSRLIDSVQTCLSARDGRAFRL
jgi:two-component system, OmpR family, response regulator RstA